MKQIKNKAPLLGVLTLILLVVLTLGVGAEDYNYTPGDGHECKYEYSYTIAPTCTEEGHVIDACIYCGIETENSTIPMIAHNYSNAKCQSCGYVCTHGDTEWRLVGTIMHQEVCTECKDDFTPAVPHVWSDYTYDENGTWKYRYCTICGYESYEALCSHDGWEYEYVDDSTHRMVCVLCGFADFDAIQKHNWSSGNVIKQPTLSEQGIIEYTCKECACTITETLGYLDIDSIVNGATSATAQQLYEKLFEVHGEWLIDHIDYESRIAVIDAQTATMIFKELFKKFEFDFLELQDVGSSYAEFFATKVCSDIIAQGSRSPYYYTYKRAFDFASDLLVQNTLAYQQGFEDATNAVIDENPIQGLFQGMWSSVILFVFTVANGIGIGGISLMSVLITLAIVLLAWFVIKIVKG